ncbi:DsbA family protein [Agrococcus sp. SGAir0287]|uniref:DsbA family protein n=1 Tax=Agrococcus sp. SGAir0287 TaxID=2070347 RepID=UPI0010CCC95E|nr:thioredoxin domain-containing protein [Agrococcus sp. SGAir0287]QCR19902.1 hypothetical protein C1N71_11060 [Agrococcus sp. SGAir0287]
MRRSASVVSALLATLVLAGCVLVPPPAPSPAGAASGFPANMASHGVLQTDAGVVTTPEAAAAPVPTTDVGDRIHVVVYVDLLCPFCGQFEATNGAMLADAVAAGEVALETHPVSFLDRLSLGTEYSTRAANLVAAVASLHPEATPAVLRALFEQQPAEDTTGLDDDELLAIAAAAGAQSEALDEAVAAVAFRPFVEAATEAATTQPLPGDGSPLTGTPTVLVDGARYTGQPGDAAAFAAALEAARG